MWLMIARSKISAADRRAAPASELGRLDGKNDTVRGDLQLVALINTLIEELRLCREFLDDPIDDTFKVGGTD